jgi:mannose-6-phosphate isomerase-like protein (cupin superfamily)
MKTPVLTCVVLLIAGTLGAADPPGFAMWSADQLRQHDKELSTKVGPDHSARMTLADFGDHRFRMLYRDADGNPEQHDAIVDIVFVQSGDGTLVLGGTMAGRRATTAGEWVGTRLDGGERRPLTAGDIVHIPAGIPHSFLVPAGTHLTYVLLKIPAVKTPATTPR